MTSISRRNFLVGSTALACSLPAVAAESKNKFDESANVVVVGLGGAGAALPNTMTNHPSEKKMTSRTEWLNIGSNTHPT